MNEFPTTEESIKAILEIIATAKNRVVLISPYVDPSDKFYVALQKASNEDKRIFLVCNQSRLKPDIRKRLERIRNVQVLYYHKFHGKAYFNENVILQTSLNLLESSEKNIETGTIIKRVDNEDRFFRACAIPEKILQAAIADMKNSNGNRFNFDGYKYDSERFDKYRLTFFKEIADQKGVCIRCLKEMQYLDGTYALCDSCYNTWYGYSNFDYEERYCHWCAKPYPTSKRKPFCYSCWQKYQELEGNQPGSSILYYGSKKSSGVTEDFVPVEKATLSGEPTVSEEAGRNLGYVIAFARHNFFKIALIIGLFVAIVFAYSFFSHAGSNSDPKAQYVVILNKYFNDMSNNRFDARNYYAPNVEQYIKVKNLSSDSLNALIAKDSKEFMNSSGTLIDSSITLMKEPDGRNSVEYWMHFLCFRKSKVQWERCDVHIKMIFDSNKKIVGYKELEHSTPEFTFQKPK